MGGGNMFWSDPRNWNPCIRCGSKETKHFTNCSNTDEEIFRAELHKQKIGEPNRVNSLLYKPIRENH